MLLIVVEYEFIFVRFDELAERPIRSDPDKHVGVEAAGLHQVVKEWKNVYQTRAHIAEEAEAHYPNTRVSAFDLLF